MKHAEIQQAGSNDAEIYAKVEKAIIYLTQQSHNQPDLDTVATQAGLSSSHFQRVFKRLAGVSPKRFLQYTTLQEAKTLLKQNHSVMAVAYDVGLSGAGRLHDLFVHGEAVTPGDFKKGGDGLTIRYGVHPTAFGYAFIGVTPHGICELGLRSSYEEAALTVNQLRRKFPNAGLVEDAAASAEIAQIAFSQGQGSVRQFPLHLRGTNFQLKVWQAVLQIPEGALTTYSELASAVDAPKAMRAVGSAVGDNPIAFLIPCHRVLRKDGGIGGYATGLPRKQAMLAYESLAVKSED